MLGAASGTELAQAAVIQLAERLGPQTAFIGAGDWLPSNWTSAPAADPWAELVRCEVLITASGISMWEAAAVGIPIVPLLVAANQKLVFAWAQSTGTRGIDVLGATDARALTDALVSTLPNARPLPRLRSGAHRVVEALRPSVACLTR
jgi:hypothetical protein